MKPFNDKLKSVALVRMDRIGDFLLWLSAAKFYRQYFSSSKIVFFANEVFASLARKFPYWDQVITVSVPDSTSAVCSLSKFEEFDLAINLHFSRTFTQDSFLGAIPAKRRIAVRIQGPNMNCEQYRLGNSIYSDLIDLDLEPKHELQRNFDIMNLITGLGQSAQLEDLRGRFSSSALSLPKKYAAVFPSASWKKRAYPWPRLLGILKSLWEEHGILSVILGGKEDKVLGANIHRNAMEFTLDLCGKQSLEESLFLIQGSQLVIANDSMAAHAANFLSKPSVCIVGGGYHVSEKEGRFFPYPKKLISEDLQISLRYPIACESCNNLCRYADTIGDCLPCIDYISAELVSASVKKVVKSSKSGQGMHQ